MTNEQRQRIVALSLASRKASEEFGGAAHSYAIGSALVNLNLVREIKQEAEDAYAALMAAIYEATEDQQSNEWIEEPVSPQQKALGNHFTVQDQINGLKERL